MGIRSTRNNVLPKPAMACERSFGLRLCGGGVERIRAAVNLNTHP